MEQKSPLCGYILAGGKSLRFGSDKARALLHGQALISRIAAVLQRFCSSIVVVADEADKYADLDLATLADAHPGYGPISGLETALCHAGASQWIMVIACDWAILPSEFLEPLVFAPRDAYGAIAYYDDRWQPMPGLYHASILPIIHSQMRVGEFALWRLLESVSAQRVKMPTPEYRGLQINTRLELDRLNAVDGDFRNG